MTWKTMEPAQIVDAATEQRTANLIAVYQDQSLSGRLSLAAQNDLADTILTRLNLKEQT